MEDIPTQRNLISPEGCLQIPLYHGTTSFFLDSIRQHGLGAIDIHQAYGTRALARRLLQTSGSFREHEAWLLTRYGCERLAGEPSPEYSERTSGFSYRYGGLFTTPSRQRAMSYAVSNKFGEGIGVLHEMLMLCVEHDLQLESRDRAFLDMLNAFEAVPVLFELRNVKVSQLRAEQGGSPHATLARLASCFAEEEDQFFHLIAQQSNFEIFEMLPPASYSAFTIEPAPNDFMCTRASLRAIEE